MANGDISVISAKIHTPLEAENPKKAAEFLQGGYNRPDKPQLGFGVAEHAAIDGSFAFGNEGDQGYYIDMTDRGVSGHDLFISDVTKMKKLFEARANEGKPIRYIIKPGIGGQHTPFQAIAGGLQVIDFKKGIVTGEYELGKDYEAELAKILHDLGAGWDEVSVIPSSKSGSTDETMMIFTDIFYAMLKNMAMQAGIANAGKFAGTVFDAMHDINFPGGKELKGADIFKNMTLAFIANALNSAGVEADERQVQQIFALTLRNMVFETTERPGSSRLAAFLASPLVSSLGQSDKPVVVSMFDNVGGRWTADLHMMTFLAYHNLNAEEYWQVRYNGIKEVRARAHQAYELGGKIVGEGITDIALMVPEELFWFGKAMEQNFNESIWQNGFANLIAVKECNWKYQEKYYAGKPSRLVINLSSLDIPGAVDLGPVNLQKLAGEQEKVNRLGELFTMFYGITNTVGNRLIARALGEKEYKPADIDLKDLNNPATRIFQQNLYLRQPYVELGKGMLEEKLSSLQAKGEAAVKAEFKNNIVLARQKRFVSSNVPVASGGKISSAEELTGLIGKSMEYAEKTRRKLTPFMYLEGGKFYELRERLIHLGVEWVMQGTGDQHISYQQVLAQPQRYLPFIISFLPETAEKAVSGKPAIGFAKGYLNNISPHMVRDLFAEASYRALTEPRMDEAGKEVKGAAGIFLRMIDSDKDRAMIAKSFEIAGNP